MLVVVKPDILRICIDPRVLNNAICREHYRMPTIDEAVTRLINAKKKFTVVDAKYSSWQNNQATRLRSTRHCCVIYEIGCHLGSALPQPYGNEPCMSMLKI